MGLKQQLLCPVCSIAPAPPLWSSNPWHLCRPQLETTSVPKGSKKPVHQGRVSLILSHFVQPLPSAEMGSYVTQFFCLHSSQTDPLQSCVPEPHKPSCDKSFMACLKVCSNPSSTSAGYFLMALVSGSWLLLRSRSVLEHTLSSLSIGGLKGIFHRFHHYFPTLSLV